MFLFVNQAKFVEGATDTTGGTSTSGVASAGYVEAFPISISSSGSIQSIGVNWAGTQIGNVRVALHSAGSSKPGTLLVESVSTAMATTARWQDVSVTGYSVTGGSYWVAIQISVNKGAFFNVASRSYYSLSFGPFDSTWSSSSSQDSAAQFNVRMAYSTGPPPADFAITSAPTSQSTGTGGAVQYLLTLTPSSYAGAAVTLSLDGTTPCSLVTEAICAFTPSGPITLSGSTPVSATLSVATVIGGFIGTTSLLVDANNGTVTRTVTLSLTVSAPPNYGFNVKGTATQVVVTLMFSTSATPPAATFTLVEQNLAKLMEPAGQVYDRTSIVVLSGAVTYNVIHRVTWTSHRQPHPNSRMFTYPWQA